MIDDDNNSMKSYGLFNMLRGLLRCVTALIGGIFAKKISVGVSYTLLCIYPTFMIIFTLFFFKETSVRSRARVLTFVEEEVVQQSPTRVERPTLLEQAHREAVHLVAFDLHAHKLYFASGLQRGYPVHAHQKDWGLDHGAGHRGQSRRNSLLLHLPLADWKNQECPAVAAVCVRKLGSYCRDGVDHSVLRLLILGVDCQQICVLPDLKTDF